MRPGWSLPPDDELKKQIEEQDSASADERIERYKFIWSEFGPPAEMLLVGGASAALALDEIKLCYIEGCYLACVLLSQLFIENSLGGSYILSGDEKAAEKGFAQLIDRALADNYIDSDLAIRLHELRQMRNPYTHPKAGAGSGTLIKRMVDRYNSGQSYESHVDFAGEDAKIAVAILVDFLRDGSRRAGYPCDPPSPNKDQQ
jgi:hypothetical protein